MENKYSNEVFFIIFRSYKSTSFPRLSSSENKFTIGKLCFCAFVGLVVGLFSNGIFRKPAFLVIDAILLLISFLFFLLPTIRGIVAVRKEKKERKDVSCQEKEDSYKNGVVMSFHNRISNLREQLNRLQPANSKGSDDTENPAVLNYLISSCDDIIDPPKRFSRIVREAAAFVLGIFSASAKDTIVDFLKDSTLEINTKVQIIGLAVVDIASVIWIAFLVNYICKEILQDFNRVNDKTVAKALKRDLLFIRDTIDFEK